MRTTGLTALLPLFLATFMAAGCIMMMDAPVDPEEATPEVDPIVGQWWPPDWEGCRSGSLMEIEEDWSGMVKLYMPPWDGQCIYRAYHPLITRLEPGLYDIEWISDYAYNLTVPSQDIGDFPDEHFECELTGDEMICREPSEEGYFEMRWKKLGG